MVKSQENPSSYTEIPPKIRSFVYLIGMLGFPVVAATYTLVVLSSDLRDVDRRISQLATRIDERPMGLERTTDFIIYVTESMRSDLKSGIYDLVNNFDLQMPKNNEDIRKRAAIINRSFEGYVRPIVRKHERFASRFPSVGGNIGSLFFLAAPSEDISQGHMEGYLTGQTHKHFGESLIALLSNNIHQFGHKKLRNLKEDSEKDELTQAFPLISEMINSKKDDEHTTQKDFTTEENVLISKKIFIELSVGVIDSSIVSLQDQMIERIRMQNSDAATQISSNEKYR